MGFEICCTKKMTEIEGDVIFEKTTDGEIKAKLLTNAYEINNNKEKKFEALYPILQFTNEAVKDKWKQLPKFCFDLRTDTQSLAIVQAMPTSDGLYYGFV
eukprot:TRINITY_DN10539_c0_g4_i2.p1 TRINITY_DN10539_c0_g4~~TRINITY_DN10539_c0_g4_i2.p1  ORF type:complete len:100 (+),score=17.13 TRINITY_DN10539_c0_g4_i2:150-449(+)